MSRFIKGCTSWNKGKSLSKEHRNNLSNSRKGFVMSKEQKENIRKSTIGKRKGNQIPNWKGDKVGYSALHIWVRKWKPKPNVCEECKINSPKEVANINGKYLRDISDYRWLCMSCHKRRDKIIKNIKHMW
ncbi:hypothetical protein LCGC14_0625950 [marine sediment metagenome]|uniref:Nuclease associated modular domain-containing protein n=1 Tax=marine sediment metagenome TaxID=412755 RepID=A0A0F9TPV2_9ZZZZ